MYFGAVLLNNHSICKEYSPVFTGRFSVNSSDVVYRFGSSGYQFLWAQVGGNYLDSSGWRRVGCGCDSAVGGFLPQIRGESLVFGETEGEFRRERDLGCSSENGVSIFAVFSTLACQTSTGGWLYVSVF